MPEAGAGMDWSGMGCPLFGMGEPGGGIVWSSVGIFVSGGGMAGSVCASAGPAKRIAALRNKAFM